MKEVERKEGERRVRNGGKEGRGVGRRKGEGGRRKERNVGK